MIFKKEIELIRHKMTDTITSAVKGNRKYISTYYQKKKSLKDPVEEDPERSEAIYGKIILFSSFCGHSYYITDIYLEKKLLKFDYTDYTRGMDHTGTIDILPVEVLYSILKWLQQHNYLDGILQVKYCYFCGKTSLQKLAWVDANADNKFIEFYDEYDNNVFCDKCQHNTSYLEYNKTDVPIELVNQWFEAVPVDILEEITGLSTKNFKNDTGHSEFRSKCNQFWEVLSETVKRDFWIRFREI